MADDFHRPARQAIDGLSEVLACFDLVCVVLRERSGQTAAQVRTRHCNLE